MKKWFIISFCTATLFFDHIQFILVKSFNRFLIKSEKIHFVFRGLEYNFF